MKVNQMDRSKDWLNQGNSDLTASNNAANAGDYAWACFLAQQTAEKALKAIGEKNNLILWGHDLVDLFEKLKKRIKIPKFIQDHCRVLNLYYISTRYPDAFSSGYPAEKFSDRQAREAIISSKEVLEFARIKLT